MKVKKGKLTEGLMLLFLILLVFILFLFQYPRAIGKGQIFFPLVEVKYPYDMKIIDLNVKEGQEVKKGDVLFSFAIEQLPTARLLYQRKVDIADLKRLALEKENEKILIEKTAEEEIKFLEKQLLFKNQRRSYLRDIILKNQKQLDRMKNLNILNIYTFPEIERIERFLEELKNENLLLEEEIVTLKNTIQKIRNETEVKVKNIDKEIKKIKLEIEQIKQKEETSITKNYLSPIAGKVDRIFVYSGEYCIAGQILMNLLNTEKLEVIAYFPEKFRKVLSPGKQAEIKFLDGQRLKGKILNVFSTTEYLPVEFQLIRQPTLRGIVAEIEITDRVTDKEKFYGMQVEVYVK